MTKFLVRWQPKPLTITSEERAELNLVMFEWIKDNLNSGKFTDWGEYCDASGGYSIFEGNEAELLTEVLRWMPYFTMEAKPVLNIDQTIESFKGFAIGKKSE